MPEPLPSGFETAALELIFRQSAGAGLDSGLDPWARFLSGVVKGLLARRDHADSDKDGSEPSAFVLGEVPQERGPGQLHRMFAQGLVCASGHVWYMNEEARVGRGVTHHHTPDQLIEFLGEEPQSRMRPTVIYIPEAVESPIIFFRNGVADEAARSDFDFVTATAATPQAINDAIDRLYEEVLKSPNGMFGSFRAWEDGDTWKPVPDAEKALQAQVRATLVNAVPGIHATEEEQSDTGRFDIGLVSEQNGTKNYHGVLELKVLRRGGPAVQGVVREGVTQAFAYAQSKGSTWSELCTFDMRKADPDEDIFLDVAADAATLNVLTRKWFMFSTFARYRDYLARAALASAENE